MTVKELRDALKDFEDDVEVMTKKTEILGNAGYVNSVKQDTYGFLVWICPVYCLQTNMQKGANEE